MSKGFSISSAAILLFLFAIMAGCNGNRRSVQPEVLEGWEKASRDESRETVVLSPADENVTYRYGNAMVDTVLIRHGMAPAPGAPVVVEALVKGALPDGCSELHEVIQGKKGGALDITLKTRRPVDSICTMAIRPFQFYLILNERLPAGRHTLLVNGAPFPFAIR